jgi:hypothetical protein
MQRIKAGEDAVWWYAIVGRVAVWLFLIALVRFGMALVDALVGPLWSAAIYRETVGFLFAWAATWLIWLRKGA